MAADITTGKSWGGTIASILMLQLSQVAKSDIIFYFGCISAIVTIGYTSHKWYILYINHHKKHKK